MDRIFVVLILVGLIVVTMQILIKPDRYLSAFHMSRLNIPYDQKVLIFRIMGSIVLFFGLVALFLILSVQ